jgi:hypothetical protein
MASIVKVRTQLLPARKECAHLTSYPAPFERSVRSERRNLRTSYEYRKSVCYPSASQQDKPLMCGGDDLRCIALFNQIAQIGGNCQ